jgi:hypothetical protein
MNIFTTIAIANSTIKTNNNSIYVLYFNGNN